MIISRKVEPQFHPPLYFNNVPIKNVTTHKHLGLTFSNDGSWTTHINEISNQWVIDDCINTGVICEKFDWTIYFVNDIIDKYKT
jgi:hypothetical protein